MSDHLPYRGHDEAETTGIGLAPSAMATAEAVGIGIGDTIPEGPPDAEHKRKLGIAAWIAITWLVVMLLLAILAPVLPIPDPTETFPEIARQGPSSGHLLGGDALGRDLLSRIIWGGRASFAVGFGAVAVGLAVGGLLGLITGFFRGRVDAIVTPLMSLLLAIPQFVLALSLVTVLASADDVSSARRIGVVIVGLGVVSIPILGRITRANTLAWSEREFVTAAKAMGAKNFRIMFRDVLPNVVPAMLSIALLGVGVAIIAEGGLSVFGVGVQLPTPSWGNIIAEARGQLRQAPHIVLFTSVVLFFTVLSLNFLGDVISQRFEVREGQL
ncbi:MAG: ABC transporter permease [Microthrixaceae bacterium]|nr:ABC transporter permease [Microthrixaceae bacterium]MCB1011073.1 ABC transporter permease [Microthrixaceae bacterium]MCB9386690.1 ABC transporter permease [Microthrixaceae bacterium]MCO5319939.1 ABC transporter permease [Microthrixaceae bacterium]